MAALIYFILGILVTILITLLFMRFTSQWEEFKERFSRWYNRRILRKEGKPPKIGTITLTGVEEARLKPVRIGAMLLPIRIFVGGDGKTRYTFPDGIICEGNPEKLVLPKDMQDSYSKFLEKRRKEAEDRGAVFEPRDHVRLDDYEIGLSGIEDAPWPLKLIVSTTDYYTIQATNYSIEETLPGGATIREKHASDPGELKNSHLGNPLATNLSVVTADQKIYVSVRGKKTAVTPAGFAPAVSGTGNPLTDRTGKGIYSPFITAQRESSEEITSDPPDLSEITFFGLARTLRWQLPFLFGELRLSEMTSTQLESSSPRDIWETEAFVAMPLEVDTIIEFIRKVYREMDEKSIVNSATYAAIFSLIQSLHYQYPDEWRSIIRELSTLEKR